MVYGHGKFRVRVGISRPAGRCLQLVRPIRGRGIRKGANFTIITCADPVHGKKNTLGETGVHWDTGSIGSPPLVENLQHTEPMRCHFLEAWEPTLYKSTRAKKIMQYKKVGE